MHRCSLVSRLLGLPLLLLALTPALHASFIINYTDTPGSGFYDATYGASRRACFEWAVNYWDTWLGGTDPVPIRIDTGWANLGSGVLGSSASSYGLWQGAAFPLQDTWYGDALADYLYGSDIYFLVYGTTHWDMELTFNSQWTDWNYDYTLPDGSFPGDVDFASVSMHEICHGLGLFDSFDEDGYWGYYDNNDHRYEPLIYDRFLEYSNGTDLISSRPATSVTSPTYWNGAYGTSANGGNRIRIYAPGTYEPGSSLAHMDDATFPGYLMTHAIGYDDERRDIDPQLQGMLWDLGWRGDNKYIPEPGTCVLLLPGLVVLALRRRRRES